MQNKIIENDKQEKKSRTWQKVVSKLQASCKYLRYNINFTNTVAIPQLMLI